MEREKERETERGREGERERGRETGKLWQGAVAARKPPAMAQGDQREQGAET